MPQHNETLIFLHIPKTAGTTLQWIIERQYDPSEIYTLRGQHDVPALEQLPLEQKLRLRAIKGHMGFGIHRTLPQPSTYLTLLRDPVDRVISSYYYIRRTPKHPHYDAIASENLSLEEFIRRGISKIATDNGQTRLSLVGVVERFDETLLLAQQRFGWRTPFYLRKNIGTNRLSKADVPRETLRLIEEYNSLDLELYQFARNLFEEAVRAQGHVFSWRIRLFRLANRVYAYPLARKLARGLVGPWYTNAQRHSTAPKRAQ